MKRKSLMIFSLVILGLFMINSMVPLVSAGRTINFSGSLNNPFEVISNLLANTFGATRDNGVATGFAGLLMVFIVVMLVYTVLDFVNIFPKGNGKEWIQWVVSIAIGILAFLFVGVDTILSLSAQYEALGVTLVAILPAIIVLTFAFRLKMDVIQGDKGLGAKILSNAILIIYTLYILVYDFPYDLTAGVRMIHVVIALVMIAFMFLGSGITKLFGKAGMKNSVDASLTKNTKRAIRRLKTEMRDEMDSYYRSETDTERKEAAERYNDVADRLGSIIGKKIPRLK